MHQCIGNYALQSCIKDNVFAIMHWWKNIDLSHCININNTWWHTMKIMHCHCRMIANANMLLWQCANNFALMQMNWQLCIDANTMTIIHQCKFINIYGLIQKYWNWNQCRSSEACASLQMNWQLGIDALEKYASMQMH